MPGLKHIPLFILLTFIIASCTSSNKNNNPYKGSKEPETHIHLVAPQYQEFLEEHQYIHNLLDSFEYYSKNELKIPEARIRIKIADYLRSTGNYSDGIKFLNSIIKQENTLDTEIKANAFYNLSAIYYELYYHRNKEQTYLDSTQQFAKKALKLNKGKNSKLTAGLLNVLGGTYLQRNQNQKAIIYLDSALQTCIARNMPADPALLNNLAFAYKEVGKYEQAIKYAQKCHKFSLQNGDEVLASISLETLTDIYRAKGDSIMAAKTNAEANAFELNNNAILRKLIAKELILNYHHNKDYEKINTLNEEHYYLIGLSWLLTFTAIILIIGILLILYFMRQNKKLHKSEKELQQSRLESNQLKLKNTELELHTKEAESKALKSELDKKEANLAAKLTALSQSNEFLFNLRKEINKLNKNPENNSSSGKLSRIEEKIAQQLNGNIWEEFELLYSSGNSSFIKKLSEQHPELTTNDKRLCYLIMMNLSTKEISDILSKSSRSVEVARHRLRNKLGLARGNNLHTFLLDFSKNL